VNRIDQAASTSGTGDVDHVHLKEEMAPVLLALAAPDRVAAQQTVDPTDRRETRTAAIVGAVARKFSLTCQEANVLMAASRGETKKEIAFALGITVRTVEYYWTQIFRKLNCGSQIGVMALLFRFATDERDPGIY
jgi:DNA-binding NarL/FixJ family response regulator